MTLTKEIAHAVLEQRHDQENLDLSTSQMVQRAKAVESALGPLNDSHAAALAAASTDAEKKALQIEQAKAVAEVRKNVQEQLHAKNGPKGMMLAEQQFQEVMGVVAVLAPAHADGIRAEQRQLEEVSKLQDAQHQKMQQRLDALLTMQQDVDSQKEAAIEAEMAKLEQVMEAALQEEQTKVANEVAALKRRKTHAINKVEAEHEALEAKAASADQKQAMKEKHSAELNKLRETLDKEEQRQVHALQASLEAQSQKRQLDKKAALERKLSREAEKQKQALQNQMDQLKNKAEQDMETQKAQLMEAKSDFGAQEQAKTADELAKLREAFDKKLEQESDPQHQEKIQQQMSENLIQATQPMMQMMEASNKQALNTVNAVPQMVSDTVQSATKPMMDRMARIETLLMQANGDTPTVYHDSREAAWQRGASDTVQLQKVLSPVQSEVHSMSSDVLDKLQPPGAKNVRTVKAAANLPSTTMSGNAFSQSYHFDEKSGDLFVRAERLDSAGEMMVVLAHANAHIRSGVMDNDQDPSFQREFYGGLMSLMDQSTSDHQAAKKAAAAAAPGDAKINAAAEDILQQAENAAAAVEKAQESQKANQGVQLERRRTEARKKRAEQVKKNVTAKLKGEGPRITAAQARAQQAMVKKLFQAIDTDGDGMLNSTEIKALCVGSGVELTQEKHDKFMEQFTRNNDGLVPFEEFFKWYSSSLTGTD